MDLDWNQMNGMALIWIWTFSQVALVSKVCSGGASALHALASMREHEQKPLLVGSPVGRRRARVFLQSRIKRGFPNLWHRGYLLCYRLPSLSRRPYPMRGYWKDLARSSPMTGWLSPTLKRPLRAAIPPCLGGPFFSFCPLFFRLGTPFFSFPFFLLFSFSFFLGFGPSVVISHSQTVESQTLRSDSLELGGALLMA